MERPCPYPLCRDGRAPTRPSSTRTRSCPVCRGRGAIDERDEDLLAGGIVVPDATAEDFRSQPFLHWPS